MHVWHGPRLLALLSLLLLAGCDKDAERIELTRRMGRLAPLPAQARSVQVYELSNAFAPAFWLRFEAPPEAIDAFLAASPGLAGVTPRRLCTREETAAAQAQTDPFFHRTGDHELSLRTGDSCKWRVVQVLSKLTWFDVVRVQKGRLYDIPLDGEANSGLVVVDEERHVVYVKVTHS
jgi:hypothetical protein